jgi:putative NADH-flavin reductase
MKIAVYGATGIIGSRIVAEARGRGHDVTALARTASDEVQASDLADAAQVREVAAKHDVVVSATGPSRTGAPAQPWLDAVQTLIDSAGATRVLFVGGAGSLVVKGTRLLDTPEFPEAYKPEALAGAAALELFRAAPESVDWTFFSPAPVIAPGERTGTYVLGTESPAGTSISAEDYAVALLDELEQPAYRRARFTAATA